MKITNRGSRGSARRWPLDLDTHDPEGIASFCLGLGYEFNLVVNTVRDRCNLDTLTARSIVTDVARKDGHEVPTHNQEAH